MRRFAHFNLSYLAMAVCGVTTVFLLEGLFWFAHFYFVRNVGFFEVFGVGLFDLLPPWIEALGVAWGVMFVPSLLLWGALVLSNQDRGLLLRIVPLAAGMLISVIIVMLDDTVVLTIDRDVMILIVAAVVSGLVFETTLRRLSVPTVTSGLRQKVRNR